ACTVGNAAAPSPGKIANPPPPPTSSQLNRCGASAADVPCANADEIDVRTTTDARNQDRNMAHSLHQGMRQNLHDRLRRCQCGFCCVTLNQLPTPSFMIASVP